MSDLAKSPLPLTIILLISATLAFLSATSCSYPKDRGDGSQKVDDSQKLEGDGSQKVDGSQKLEGDGSQKVDDSQKPEGDGSQKVDGSQKPDDVILNPDGDSIETRFLPPQGFSRIAAEPGSFCEFLRKLPLKQDGTDVKLYDGRLKTADVHSAVIDLDIGTRDLQQCADAVIRLRAEYLYGKGSYDSIHFNFTNGFVADYKRWLNGERIAVDGNKAYWVEKTSYSNDYSVFRKYLEIVFAYAGSLSLSREMDSIQVEEAQPGDVFIKGGSPGHAVIVIDMAENAVTHQKVFMLAQSYMPAQDIHILKNNNDESISPWYPLDFGSVLVTPQWQFDSNQLMRFRE